MKALLVALSLLCVSIPIWAVEKHPRVAELEDKFKKDANNYLEARFPGLPFSVAVSIDPLRRTFTENYNIKGEVLPFYALDEEGIQDEWDDPTATLYTLTTRVKKIFITVQVPETLSQEELDEVKISLTQILRLVPARDDIEVVKRKWTLFPNLKTYALAAIGGIAVFLLGLFAIFYLSTKKVSTSLENVQAYLKSSASGGSGGNVKLPTQSSAINKDDGGSGPKGGDIRFNDPIKMREVILMRIDDLVENKALLSLENMRLLDEFGQSDPHALGALLILFPMELQREFFAFSNGPHWMEALAKPGALSMKTLDLLEELAHVKTSAYRENWEKLLIQIWRMEDAAGQFLKSLDTEKALALLGAMPKFVSLPLARSIFPGNWASLLDPHNVFKTIDDGICKELYQASLIVKPLETFDILDVYKKDMELLQYVEMSDVRTEQEIYEAAPLDSMLKRLRPPFYVLFQQPESLLKEFHRQFDISDWALALFNVPREQRKLIEYHFSDKEKFYFIELLQGLDHNRPSLELTASIRTQIAVTLHGYLAQMEQMGHESTSMDEEVNSNDDNAESAA